MPQTDNLDNLQSLLDYKFREITLLRLALTHSSARSEKDSGEDNERLEFLGDRVLGLAVAELLQIKFPEAAEGELARRFNKLVRTETCATIAAEFDLGPYLILGDGEHESGGRRKPTILANACEAVLGAVFLDGGYEAAQKIVHQFWLPHLLDTDAIPVDPKSALQEWAQSKRIALPEYKEIARQGPDHAPSFTAEVQIKGVEPAQGRGNSKRAAEQAAARTMLLREGIWDDTVDV